MFQTNFFYWFTSNAILCYSYKKLCTERRIGYCPNDVINWRFLMSGVRIQFHQRYWICECFLIFLIIFMWLPDIFFLYGYPTFRQRIKYVKNHFAGLFLCNFYHFFSDPTKSNQNCKFRIYHFPHKMHLGK